MMFIVILNGSTPYVCCEDMSLGLSNLEGGRERLVAGKARKQRYTLISDAVMATK